MIVLFILAYIIRLILYPRILLLSPLLI